MIKQLNEKYDKALIAGLPQAQFGGRIEVVVSQYEAERAVAYLSQQPLIGIDTETRPSFRRGQHFTVALLQVSTREICFLFRLNHLGLARPLRELLEDRRVTKVGLSLHDDVHALSQLGTFTPRGFIDLQDHVREVGVEDMSLQKIFANFFHRRISKTQQLSNWEQDILSDKQKLYAATDAWACILLYEELQRLKLTGEYQLIKLS